MSEILLEFENTIEDESGRSYVASVVGEERDDGKWVGSIRFDAVEGGESLTTDRETTQPDRDDLRYWSTGLTYFYLEGALVRARRRAAGGPGARQGGGSTSPRPAAATSPPAAEPATTAEGAGHGGAASRAAVPHTPRLEVLAADPAVVERLLGDRHPRPGTVRDVPDAGTLVYEGPGAGGESDWHRFAVRYGSRNEGVTLANWLWSRLQGSGSAVRVNGAPVELTHDALAGALLGEGGAPDARD